MPLYTSRSTMTSTPSEQRERMEESTTGRIEAYQKQRLGQLGFWSAILVAVGSLGFCLPALMKLLGLITPSVLWDRILGFAPSLLLALAFVVLMSCIHSYAPAEKRFWSQIGLAFAIAYMVLVGLVYSVQLITVVPLILQGEANTVAFLNFDGTYRTFMSVIDTFGYAIQGLATLFAAPVFSGDRLQRWIRWLFIANGILVPAFLLNLFNWMFIFLAAWWIIPIPVSAILLAVLFKRVERMAK